METPSTPPLQKDEWQLYGRCINKSSDKDGTGYHENGITFKEQISNLQWGANPIPRRSSSGATNDIFGKPIDGNLAGKLIKAAHTAIEDFKKLLDDRDLHNKGKKNYLDVANFLTLLNGITFDKTVVLKILSQPNCEGLRAYLCKRDNVNNDVSLVLVGVDANGFDLNFPDPKSVRETADTTNIPNQSLMAEYGYPPGSKDKAKWESEIPGIDMHYILLMLALS